jgi:hypothetical protein
MGTVSNNPWLQGSPCSMIDDAVTRPTDAPYPVGLQAHLSAHKPYVGPPHARFEALRRVWLPPKLRVASVV